MELAIAEIVLSSLKNVYQAMGIPMALADELGDKEIRRSIGNLCALMCTEIDLKITPILCKKYPHLNEKIEKDYGLVNKPRFDGSREI